MFDLTGINPKSKDGKYIEFSNGAWFSICWYVEAQGIDISMWGTHWVDVVVKGVNFNHLKEILEQIEFGKTTFTRETVLGTHTYTLGHRFERLLKFCKNNKGFVIN